MYKTDEEYLAAFKNILETVSKFYHKDGSTNDITVDFKEAESAYCSKDNNIVIPPSLIELFSVNDLPKFCLYYHELGHVLWSQNMFSIIEKWKNINSVSSFKFDEKYLHLINWIEDYYTENKTVLHFKYLTHIIDCLRRIPFTYDETKIEYAFNYYYVHKQVTPALAGPDAAVFDMYINDLLSLRDMPTFGIGGLSLINNNNTNFKYLKKIVDFYKWCVAKGILKDNTTPPPLRTPINIVDYDKGNGTGTGGDKDTGNQGSYSDHSNKVGVTKLKQVTPPIDMSKPIFTEELKTESKCIQRILSEFRKDTSHNSLYGLFTTEYKDTPILAKPNIKAFFNPNRLEDRVLFLEQGRTFSNVSIYRDISGSTNCDERFRLINEVCKHLWENIPIDKHFYLYASGDVSILKTEYIDWDDYDETPELYASDPIFQQLGGGTNSDAIADAMSEQLNDKWLNIIVTDGDLNRLFRRDNINALLNNVAIISVDGSCREDNINPNHYIEINSTTDIPCINDMLINFKEN